MTLRVLCLDIEGGFGGSSRSLFESIRHIDWSRVEPEVWCGRDGPIVARYHDIGVPCRIVPWSRYSALPRLSRNLLAVGRAWLGQARLRASFDELVSEADKRFDVVHANHESLFLLASRLRQRVRTPIVMHLRTMVADTIFARWQARSIGNAVDHAVFITENEQALWTALGLSGPDQTVLYNIATAPSTNVARHPSIPQDDRFRVACISNYAWVRGVDRLIEVARSLKSRQRTDIQFVVAGDMRLRGSLPGELGKIAARKGTLADYAAANGVGGMFVFLGHVDEPERVLTACDAVARPSRDNNPWGRETIEAMAASRPLVSTGTYDRFVENGVTGRLLPAYEAGAFADAVAQLADDRGLCRQFGEAGRRRVADLCNGPARANDLLAVWAKAAARRADSAQGQEPRLTRPNAPNAEAHQVSADGYRRS